MIIVIDQNCVVTGGCDLWGWIKLVLTEVWLITAIGVTIVAIVNPQKAAVEGGEEAEAEAGEEEAPAEEEGATEEAAE